MNKFYPYLRFFCDNTFAENDELLFFENGCFAITTKDKVVSLYTDEANLLTRYENAFALENGCICERYHENLIVNYSTSRYPIPCPSGTRMVPFRNAVSLTVNAITNERRLYFISPQYKDLRYIVLKDDYTAENTSPDGKAVLYSPSKGKKLINKDGEEINVDEAFARIDFLPKGGYIVHYMHELSGSAMYNDENECVLVSGRNYGILPLGDHVVYENALIANAAGYFTAEYKQEIAIFNNMTIYPYTIYRFGQSNPFFWPGGKMMCLHSNFGSALCYWHAGHFYFGPQYKDMSEFYHPRDADGFDSAFKRYLQYVKFMK